MAKTRTRYNGNFEKINEEIEMDEVTSANKALGMPDIDDEEGNKDSDDGDGGTSKASDPKTKKSKDSAKS